MQTLVEVLISAGGDEVCGALYGDSDRMWVSRRNRYRTRRCRRPFLALPATYRTACQRLRGSRLGRTRAASPALTICASEIVSLSVCTRTRCSRACESPTPDPLSPTPALPDGANTKPTRRLRGTTGVCSLLAEEAEPPSTTTSRRVHRRPPRSHRCLRCYPPARQLVRERSAMEPPRRATTRLGGPPPRLVNQPTDVQRPFSSTVRYVHRKQHRTV